MCAGQIEQQVSLNRTRLLRHRCMLRVRNAHTDIRFTLVRVSGDLTATFLDLTGIGKSLCSKAEQDLLD